MVTAMKKAFDAAAMKVKRFKAKNYAREFWRDPYAGMKKGAPGSMQLKALATDRFEEKFDSMTPVEMRQFTKFFWESRQNLNGEANEQWVTNATIAMRDGEMKKAQRSLETVVAGFERAQREGAPTV